MDKPRAIILGVLSGFLIIVGIIFGVLTHQLLEKIEDNLDDKGDDYNTLHSGAGNRVWMVGAVYVIPGVLIFISAFFQNKCFYIFSVVVAVLSSIIMGIVFFFMAYPLSVVILAYKGVQDVCKDESGNCRCEATNNGAKVYEETSFKSCDLLEDMISLIIGVMAMVVLGWVLLVVNFVTACVFSCRTKEYAGTTINPAIGMGSVQHAPMNKDARY